MTVSTQLLLMDKINFHAIILGPSITSTFKGLTRIRPLSCGFDSSVGRALHWHRRGRGFESRSGPEFFSGLCSNSVTAALALMTVNNLKVLEESDDASEIEKSRAKIRVLQIEKESLKSEYNLADLRNSGAPQKEIERQQAEVRNFASDFTKARGDYNRRYPSERFESNTRPQFEEVPDDEEPEIFDERQRIKSIIKQNEALRSRMVSDRYISENQEKTPEVRKAAKKRLEKNHATYEKNEEEKKELLERLGIKKSVLEQEREVFQKEKADLDMLIEGDKKIVDDLNSTAFEIEAPEQRITQREREIEWISERLEQTERDLGLEDRRFLREKIKQIFKKKGRYGDCYLSCCGRHNWGCYWGYHQRFEKTRKRFHKWP